MRGNILEWVWDWPSSYSGYVTCPMGQQPALTAAAISTAMLGCVRRPVSLMRRLLTS
jgi:hypothetical protein